MSTILIDQDGYKLTSYGNGYAYSLERHGWSVALQGDDATQLRDEIAAFELAWPAASRATLAAYLWNTLEYGSAAIALETV